MHRLSAMSIDNNASWRTRGHPLPRILLIVVSICSLVSKFKRSWWQYKPFFIFSSRSFFKHVVKRISLAHTPIQPNAQLLLWVTVTVALNFWGQKGTWHDLRFCKFSTGHNVLGEPACFLNTCTSYHFSLTWLYGTHSTERREPRHETSFKIAIWQTKESSSTLSSWAEEHQLWQFQKQEPLEKIGDLLSIHYGSLNNITACMLT